jgi:hypothetical protein
MAKWKRTVIGSIVKNKDPKKPDYIKVTDNVVLTKNQYLNLEGEKSQLDSLKEAIALGKISGDNAKAAQDRINKVPWVGKDFTDKEGNKQPGFVRFQVVAVSKE